MFKYNNIYKLVDIEKVVGIFNSVPLFSLKLFVHAIKNVNHNNIHYYMCFLY